MAHLPASVVDDLMTNRIKEAGLTLLHRGKVRDTFEIPNNPNLLAQVATDRLSIFDFVMPAMVEKKGEVLTALTIHWLANVLQSAQVSSHLRQYGIFIDDFLPRSLHSHIELQRRALIVRKYQIVPIECIVRGCLTGSGWSSYKKTGTVCGIPLPAGLRDGDELPEPIFTPSTKAESGHDENISYAQLRTMIGDELAAALKRTSLEIFVHAQSFAKKRGIVLADTKFEFGVYGENALVLCDEVLTPDSSRFWLLSDWQQSRLEGRSPLSYDKQVVRDWGKQISTPFTAADGAPIIGINNLDPENPQHLEWVDGITIPPEVLAETSHRYQTIFQLLTQETLDGFQAIEMTIQV